MNITHMISSWVARVRVEYPLISASRIMARPFGVFLLLTQSAIPIPATSAIKCPKYDGKSKRENPRIAPVQTHGHHAQVFNCVSPSAVRRCL